MDEKVVYEWAIGKLIIFNENLINECSELYSNHYGKWSEYSPMHPGDRVKLSAQRIKVWLDHDDSTIYTAKVSGKIIGYAIAIRLKVPKYGIISWVTQLVVHEEYRKQDIAKNLLFSIWGLSNDYAWGIVSSNPYAIRALEKATRRRSNPVRIKKNIKKIISIGIDNIPYLKENIKYKVDSNNSMIDTNFYVDHSNLNKMISSVTSSEVPWLLGIIEEGWEWLAFTFNNQKQIELSESEIEKMIQTSEGVTQKAFERMKITDKHSWTANAEAEVETIIKECNLEQGDNIIDFGCGMGRHSLLLAKKGMKVTGIDYISMNIEEARKKAEIQKLNSIEFISGDCRTIKTKKAKAVVCLYDVIGSFVSNEENIKILNNISEHLIDGGIALISVMNFEMTNNYAKHRFSFKEQPNKLLDLPASQIMETTGNIFDPDYYMIEDDTNIVYRKEQFLSGNDLPVELIVRDKRFTKAEIESMCESVGLKVLFSRFVNARNWEVELNPTDKAAKEILVKCIKVSSLNF